MLRLLVLSSLVAVAFSSFSCKDQHNANVPWFAAYKMPKQDGETVGAKAGTGFYYLDSADRSSFKVSAVSIDQEHQAIGYTLNQYYANKGNKDVMHVFYNDEVPTGVQIDAIDPKAVEFGHTKGAVIFDGKTGTGVWLIHSVPKFPHPSQYQYPASGVDYGQTFLCLTLSASTLPLLGTALFYNHPQIYGKSEPDWVKGFAPDLDKVLNGQYNTDASKTLLHQSISVVGSESSPPKFELFAKTHLFKNDLWAEGVAPVIGSLEVESWRRGDEIATDCKSPHPVYDAATIAVGKTPAFSYTKDHSKYARSMSSSVSKVCIGDINRMTSQYQRGGGTVCVQDAALWKAFSVFQKTNTC